MKTNNALKVHDHYYSAIFVFISYAVTWSILFPLSMVYSQLSLFEREIWHSLGSIGPSIGAIIVIYLAKRREGLKLLL